LQVFEPRELVAASINGYLVDGPNVLVSPRSAPLSADLSSVTFGNMPRDGGHLIVDDEIYPQVSADPIALKYLRPFIGSEELVNGRTRWYLWMTDLEPDDVAQSAILAERIAGMREMRLKSKAPSTKAMAATPHLLGQRSGGYPTPYLGIPRVVSENRPFYTAARLGPEVIPSDRLFATEDEDGFLFGVMSSSMFLVWQLTVGNRLESRPSFSNTLVWNNFPLPPIEHEVLAARQAHPEKSLAAIYAPGEIPHDLIAALDAVVDIIFGSSSSPVNFEERQRVLSESFVKLDSGLLAGIDSAGKKRGR